MYAEFFIVEQTSLDVTTFPLLKIVVSILSGFFWLPFTAGDTPVFIVNKLVEFVLELSDWGVSCLIQLDLIQLKEKRVFLSSPVCF